MIEDGFVRKRGAPGSRQRERREPRKLKEVEDTLSDGLAQPRRVGRLLGSGKLTAGALPRCVGVLPVAHDPKAAPHRSGPRTKPRDFVTSAAEHAMGEEDVLNPGKFQEGGNERDPPEQAVPRILHGPADLLRAQSGSKSSNQTVQFIRRLDAHLVKHRALRKIREPKGVVLIS